MRRSRFVAPVEYAPPPPAAVWVRDSSRRSGPEFATGRGPVVCGEREYRESNYDRRCASRVRDRVYLVSGGALREARRGSGREAS